MRHVEQEESEYRATRWQNGSLSSSQADQPYGRNCRDALQYQPQLNVTVCHLHISGFSLILKPLAFPRNASQMNDWKRCLSCGQNSLLFFSFPVVSLTYTYTHTPPNNFHTTHTVFFLKEEKKEKKEAIICFSTLNTCETCSYKNSPDDP